MALAKRTRVEIFLPVSRDTTVFKTVTDWLAEELALARGGSTLTTPFTGLYASSATRDSVVRDTVQILFCDFDLNAEDALHRTKLLTYLNDVRFLLMEVLREEDWITYHSIMRIL